MSRRTTGLTRREFGKLALAGLAMPTAARGGDSTVAGVRIGVQTYSFRDLPRSPGGDAVDVVVDAIRECGLAECELYCPQVEPKLDDRRDELRRWRLETPLSHFTDVKRKFAAAGITIYAYNYSFDRSFTDDEIARGFQMARALGATIITASTTLDVAKRVAPFAEKEQMVVAVHGHSNVTDPNEFATPRSFAAALAISKYFKINLDIGHFTAANFDAVAFIRQRHADITNLHIKDRRRDQGDYVRWGTGDTPIREVLRLLRDERWPIRTFIEYEYAGGGTPVQEVKACYDYMKKALA